MACLGWGLLAVATAMGEGFFPRKLKMSRQAFRVVNWVQAAGCTSIASLLILAPVVTGDEKSAVPRFTAVDLTSKFRDDKTEKLFLQYAGKAVEVEGEVQSSQKFATGEGWSIKLKGCEVRLGQDAWVIMSFEAGNPDLPKAKRLIEGDRVTIRAEFLINYGASVGLKEPRIVKGPDKGSAGPSPDRRPELKATAEQFVKGAVADPKAAETRLKGKVVELTGPVSTADPTYSRWGVTLSAGKLKPTDPSGLSAECAVPEARLEKAWLLGKGQKVKVVGVLTAVEKDRVRLADCEVTELEPNPLPTVKAAEVAAAYARNPKDAAKRYGDRYSTKDMFLEGVVKGTKGAQYGTVVLLDGSGKIAVRAQVDSKDAEGLSPGAKVRLKATCRGYWPEEGAVLFFARVLKGPGEKR
jgi:hypothetical protein